MSYKRPFHEKPAKPHPLEVDFGHHGQFTIKNDPGWLYRACTGFMEDGNFALHQLHSTIGRVKALDLSEYKDEIAKQKRTKPVHEARLALLTFMKKYVDGAKADIARVREAILRETEPPTEKDPVRAMLQELRHQEIRGIIRATEPSHRGGLVDGNLAYIQACVGAPDDLISGEHLTDIRRAYAFGHDPSLADLEADTLATYKAVRKRAAEINATAVTMLLDDKIEDPVTPLEHYAVFEPETPYEGELAAKRILSYERQQEAAAKKREFEAMNPGVNFEAGARVTRL